MLKPETRRPIIGVSQCLLGDAVRYDGRSKANIIVTRQLSRIFDLVAVCPEVEAGLSVPRPPVQLTGDINNPELTGRDDPSINITALMQEYCNTKPAELKHLSGFIFKSRSPSCALNSAPVVIEGRCANETRNGMFAQAMKDHHPDMPVIEDTCLTDKSIDNFIRAVKNYSR
ncbi:MAG: DUF523 domain-containing protein [Proteobacteria bacterium]|nr:DUF523 domain-containing protein [Pseudomonadota bacterium]